MTEKDELTHVAPADPSKLPRSERLHALAEELGALRREVVARMGAADIAYIRKLRRFSTAMEVAGRTAIHLSLEPLTFFSGVVALWLHKQIEATEIGHTVLHGAYDRLKGAEAFSAKTFRWDMPIDEESWRHTHNSLHHGATNVAGRDPDMRFGNTRLTAQHSITDKRPLSTFLSFILPNFGFVMNSHVTGLNDVVLGHQDVLRDKSRESVQGAWRKALRKYVPYYFKNYVFFPALAGPFFPKVLLGNWLAELARDVYTGATIICGHVGADIVSWPEGTAAQGRDEWYAMQVEATNDFQVSRPLSILCGGLDYQIEHHLFPTLPPHRLREIAPRVREICEKHGLLYKTDTWGRTLRKALRRLAELGREERPVAFAMA